MEPWKKRLLIETLTALGVCLVMVLATMPEWRLQLWAEKISVKLTAANPQKLKEKLSQKTKR